MFRFGERTVRRGFSFERNVRRGTADSAARSERGEARRQDTEKPRIRGMQGFVELPGFEPGIILLTISTLCGVSYFGPTIRPFVSKYDVP